MKYYGAEQNYSSDRAPRLRASTPIERTGYVEAHHRDAVNNKEHNSVTRP